jgi:hypothetical protein
MAVVEVVVPVLVTTGALALVHGLELPAFVLIDDDDEGFREVVVRPMEQRALVHLEMRDGTLTLANASGDDIVARTASATTWNLFGSIIERGGAWALCEQAVIDGERAMRLLLVGQKRDAEGRFEVEIIDQGLFGYWAFEPEDAPANPPTYEACE